MVSYNAPEQIEKALNKLCSRKNRKLGDLLDEAKALINGDRQEDYGDPDLNWGQTAKAWSAYLTAKFDQPIELTGRDGCNLMSIAKLIRDAHKVKHDNPLDVIGYQAISDYLEAE